MAVPVIDLFAGPGGLAEGFASLRDHQRQPFFEIGLSIEKDPVAHRTLTLRALFRRLRGTSHVRYYYSYLKGEMDEGTFLGIPAVASAFVQAAAEARCLELGKSDENGIDSAIRVALKGQETWVLIGGPPCTHRGPALPSVFLGGALQTRQGQRLSQGRETLSLQGIPENNSSSSTHPLRDGERQGTALIEARRQPDVREDHCGSVHAYRWT